jgi:hypothetical protein
MNTIQSSLGLGDGEGNTSSTRLIAFVLAMGFMVVKVVNAIHNHSDIAFTNQDLGFVSVVLGSLVGKTAAEGIAAKLTPATPVPTAVIDNPSTSPIKPIQ